MTSKMVFLAIKKIIPVVGEQPCLAERAGRGHWTWKSAVDASTVASSPSKYASLDPWPASRGEGASHSRSSSLHQTQTCANNNIQPQSFFWGGLSVLTLSLEKSRGLKPKSQCSNCIEQKPELINSTHFFFKLTVRKKNTMGQLLQLGHLDKNITIN